MCKFNKIIKHILLIGLVLVSISSFSQSKNSLEKKKKQLQKEIQLTNKLLKATKKDKELSLDQLLKLKSKINARSSLISTMGSEINLINKQVNENESIIVTLTDDLTRLKEEYAKMIYYAFKNKNSYDKIMFVFAAKDFNQAYKRLKYIQQYSDYRKNQALTIIKTQEILKTKIVELEQTKQGKAVLLSLEEQEKQKLSIEEAEQKNVVNKLQDKEQDLKNELKKKEQAAKKLQKAIQRIIEEEIRKAREAAKKAGNTSKGFPMTPEAKKLSNSFASNKGKLPWPVMEGVITNKFGKHPHAVLAGITINNNGIDISTMKGAISRAIFDGEVSSVVIIPGEGKVVMIRHGEYLSVYSFMSDVYVKKGDKVSTKQHLGKLINEAGKSKTDIHLEIWKGMTKLNPEYWIYRR